MPRTKNVWHRQLIIRLQCSGNDSNPKATVTGLEEKAATKKVESETLVLDSRNANGPTEEELTKLAAAITKLGEGRLYVVGHGDWKNHNVGNWNVDKVATCLTQGEPKYALVSVTSCRAARDKIDKENPRREGVEGVYLANSADSFASRLHVELRRKGVSIDLYARVWGVQPDKGPTGLSMMNDVMDVGKSPQLATSALSTFGGRKVRFYWEGSSQKREWVLRKTGAAAATISGEAAYDEFD